MENDALICPIIRMPCIGNKCIALVKRDKIPGYYAYHCNALNIYIYLDKNGEIVSDERICTLIKH